MKDVANRTWVAIVGCGYVSDFYLATLAEHHELCIAGVYDRRPERARAVASHWDVGRVYGSLSELLADERVEIVVNLTSPASHAEISRHALLADRHVYTEKPVADTLRTARDLGHLANERGLLLSSAPSNALGVSLQTVRKAVLDGAIGRPLLVYAELDDGMLNRMPHDQWLSATGAPWPAGDEFALGCVLEHACYHLTWLVGVFGAVKQVTVLSRCRGARGNSHPVGCATDFSCALLRFRAGVIARLTCSALAPRDHSLTIVGDTGVLSVGDCWDFWAPVEVEAVRSGRTASHRLDYLDRAYEVKPITGKKWTNCYEDTHRMDFAMGIADLASAIRRGGQPVLTAAHAEHILDVSLIMDTAATGVVTEPSTSVS